MVIRQDKFTSQFENCWSDANQQLLSLDTGSWRTQRPIIDIEKCSYCGLCYIYCPVQCFIIEEKYFNPNLSFCKGCGICAKECPKDAISMISEQEF